ncbi:MAG: hypothetical protein PHN51_10205 [Candidatus Nanopelagicales bacterium]|nr:hypothetical protein [Candidatus Nanopelagicales bacterium]
MLKIFQSIKPAATDDPEFTRLVQDAIAEELSQRALAKDETSFILIKAAVAYALLTDQVPAHMTKAYMKVLYEWTKDWDVSSHGADFECRDPNNPQVVLYLTAGIFPDTFPTATLLEFRGQGGDYTNLANGSADSVIRMIAELGVPTIINIARISAAAIPTFVLGEGT